MKKWIIWGWILAALIGPANAAGTIPGFSLTPQFTKTGQVAVGCKLYTIQAGTVSTPQSSYQDSSLTILQPNPLLCDAAARLPQFFLADGQIKVRLTDANGVEIFVGDNLLVVGSSSGGGGGGTVDPTTVIATGDVKTRYGTGVLTGFVRANGRTIGSATSGATERANADAQPLFEYLWTTDPNLTVSTGRGASANADWVANKTIALPDGRNRALASLGDMGNTDAALFTGSTFANGNGITLGSRLGVGTPRSILRTDLPNANIAVASTGTATVTSSNSDVLRGAVTFPSFAYAGGGAANGALLSANSVTPGFIGATGTASVSGQFALNGGVTQTPFDTVSPFLLITTYIKL